MTCTICFEDLNHLYGMMNLRGETGQYCMACLGTWSEKSRLGCLTGLPVSSISIYNPHKIVTIQLTKTDERIWYEHTDEEVIRKCCTLF